MNNLKKYGLFLGPLAFLLVLFMPQLEGLSEMGQSVLAVSTFMVIWWATEPFPLGLTALLPIVLFPILNVDVDFLASYAHWVVVLIVSVFWLGAAIEKWGLHKRLAYMLLKLFGSKPKAILLGFISSAGILSMFMSNTTAVAMMIPIIFALVSEVSKYDDSIKAKLGSALMVGTAFGSSIGGIGTPIGTGTNMAGIALISELTGNEISFLAWMRFAVPFVVILLPLLWFFLVKLFKLDTIKLDIDSEIIQKELDALGRMNRGEFNTLVVFSIAILLWVTKEAWGDLFPTIGDHTIGAIACALLFLAPVNFSEGEFTLDFNSAIGNTPWNVVFLVGGALAMGGAIAASGVADWIGYLLEGIGTYPELVVIILFAVIIAFISEVATNMVVAAVFIPIVAGLAPELGVDPAMLMLTVTVASGFAFMLPQGTPPTALAYSSGLSDAKTIMFAGFLTKLICLAVLPIVLYAVRALGLITFM